MSEVADIKWNKIDTFKPEDADHETPFLITGLPHPDSGCTKRWYCSATAYLYKSDPEVPTPTNPEDVTPDGAILWFSEEGEELYQPTHYVRINPPEDMAD